jgi:hypothetical protein
MFSLLPGARSIPEQVPCATITFRRSSRGGRSNKPCASQLWSRQPVVLRSVIAFATHLLQDGEEIRTDHELLGHEGIRSTMSSTREPKKDDTAVRLPNHSAMAQNSPQNK